MQHISTFDFDGTLTRSDSLFAFLRYSVGTRRMLLALAMLSPLLVLMMFGLYSNQQAKERLLGHFFKGMPEQDFNALCARFAAHEAPSLLRPAGIDTVKRAVASGEQVAIVSASPCNWVTRFVPFLCPGADIKVMGTVLEVNALGQLTGRFATPNCYGQEKVNRILNQWPNRQNYHLTAYGDSQGDREMLALADEAHYRPFREGEPEPHQKMHEVIRFGIVGLVATAIQYGVYWLLIGNMNPTLANTLAYVVSFIFNFIASTRYTFRVAANVKHGAGFALSHVVNYLLQTLVLNLSLWMGASKQLAPLPMFCVCVPTNFLLVRYFLKK